MLGFVDLHPTNLTRPTKLNTPTPPPPKKKIQTIKLPFFVHIISIGCLDYITSYKIKFHIWI